MMTPKETVLKMDLERCRRHAQTLLTEKNLLQRQLEILFSRLGWGDEKKIELRHEANR